MNRLNSDELNFLKNNYSNVYKYYCELLKINSGIVYTSPEFKKPKYKTLTLDNYLEHGWELLLPDKKTRHVLPREEFEQFGDIKIPAIAVDEMIKLGHDKLSLFYDFHNVIEDTDEVIKKLLQYSVKNSIIGDSLGIQGVGKSTFFAKNFPRKMFFNSDTDFSCYDGIHSNFEFQVYEKICINQVHSVLFDNISHTINLRNQTRELKKKYGMSEYILFLFYGDVRTCIGRAVKRSKSIEQINTNLASMITYLTQLEQPIDDKLDLEEGITLLIGVNEQGKITHAFPKEELEEILKQ